MNILVSVNHCAPGMGSEHGVGWNFISHLSRHHNLFVICREHEYISSLIDATTSSEWKDRSVRFYFIPQHTEYRGWTVHFPLFYYKEYNRWEKRVYTLAKEIIEKESIDLVHHITNITFREPGYLWKLNKPFVWGPVGVLGDEPIRFLCLYNLTEWIKMILRRITCVAHLKYSKRLRTALTSSALCLPVSDHVRKVLASVANTRFEVMPETGSSREEVVLSEVNRRSPDEPIQLLWLSRFDHSKGVLLLLKAIESLDPKVNYELILAGDGPYRQRALNYCTKKGIRVNYLGVVSHHEVASVYREAHLFFITSLMDATTSVLFEALEAGCPIICLNHLSYSEVVDEQCGIKVDVQSIPQIAHDIRHHITHLYHHEELRYTLGRGAMEKAVSHAWSTKIKRLNSLYQSLHTEAKEE